ncbi:MAG: hypothetical protein KGO96_13980 [Elusimicrobia bacterium]|nr:hypothetical protein [Elusimicrobiota bacterium]
MNPRDRMLLADLAALHRIDQHPPAPAMVTCGACAHFRPDRHNLVAGMGFCPIFNGWNYPGTERRCRDFVDRADA